MAQLQLLPQIYSHFSYGLVNHVTDLFKSTAKQSPGLVKAKAIHDYLLTLQGVKLDLYIAQEAEIYQMNLNSGKYQIGTVYYIPEQSRIDVIQTGDYMPLIQIKGKKIVFKNYPELLEKLGLEKCFAKLVSLC